MLSSEMFQIFGIICSGTNITLGTLFLVDFGTNENFVRLETKGGMFDLFFGGLWRTVAEFKLGFDFIKLGTECLKDFFLDKVFGSISSMSGYL